ncbi:lipoyl(octanoyl) transferase LipB [Marinospirillum sp.]|uniref:lipoyl(octanoyl) transferase LipB n=1 Tax=Marinospirillum sp. TaxID=2183934 RepID=UPI003A8BB64B
MVDSALIERHLGRQAYIPTWERMRAFTEARDTSTQDELWVLEHESVFTQGLAGKEEHLLNPGDIPVVQVDRGGQVTWHGPGQLVIYLLLDIKRLHYGVRDLVNLIEQSLVAYLAQLDIEAYARPDAPGVYIEGAKIAALGLKVRRGCSFHGLSFNVAPDLDPFLRINPCGYAGLKTARLQDWRPEIDLETATQGILQQLVQRLGHAEVQRAQGWA